MKPPTLLILGGTGEAYQLAEKLANESSVSHLRIYTSLSGKTKNPQLPAGQYRIGGFGGVSGLIQFLHEEKVLAVIDVSHPYAVQISKNAICATNHTEIPLIRLDRLPWVAKTEDHWIDVSDVKTAAEWLRVNPQRAFLTIGKRDLHEFRICHGSSFIIRSVDLGEIYKAWPNTEWIHDRGPFTLDSELALIQTHQVSALVTKNSGGNASFPKLLAARQLGTTVLMIQRPPLPPSRTVINLDDAIKWCLEI